MALTATLYSCDVELAHVDRGVYETLAFRVAQHPSETEDSLLARILAYCLEYTEGLQFSAGGLSDPDAPALAVRDATGQLETWIDVGLPDAARLHRASKAARRVVVYTHKDPARLLAPLAGEKIHRAESLRLYAIDRAFLAAWNDRIARRMRFALTVTDGHLYLVLEGTPSADGVRQEVTLSGAVTALAIPAP